MTEYRVAVRALAEFCHRRGDIDYRFSPSPTGAEGIAGHQLLAGRRGDSYQPEFPLHLRRDFEGFSLEVSGRADGYDPQAGLVEEIKTCRVDRAAIPAATEQLHWAQAMLYSGLLCLEEPARQQLQVQLTYFNIDSEQEWPRIETHSREDLLEFLDAMLELYGRWLAGQTHWLATRNSSITALEFHHPDYRPGQREMAEAVYKCIAQGGQLMLQAPTGIGKTAAVLFPALKALPADKHDLISFVTARTVGRRVAEQTLAEMCTAGLRLRRLSLTAKESICFSPGKACHGDDCPYANAYYDRLPAAREAALHSEALDRQGIEVIAREFTVCPYQLSVDLIPWVDICIGDIHYIYSYSATVSALYDGLGLRWSVLLDEAHNLPDRARSMYSAGLSKAALMRARKRAPAPLKSALDRCNRSLLQLQKQDWDEQDFHSATEVPDALQRVLQLFVSAVNEQQAQQPLLLQQYPELLDFYFDVLQFQRVLEVFGEDYRFELERGEGKQSLKVRLHCLDGSRQLRERQLLPHSITAFSATLSPPHWVLEELGFADSAVYRELPSPFSADQFQVMLNTRLDTRYRNRSASLPDLCVAISDWLERHPGNCIVYFPAYRYMADALESLQGQLAGRRLLVQERQLDESGRAALLDALRSENNIVAFCILGGVFGEGVDLPGDALSSVVIVGVGLPQFDRRRQELRGYFDARVGQGYEYAYLYPGMQRVSQALGRVIRRESDRGSALLIDPRYTQSAYRSLLPPWWNYRETG